MKFKELAETIWIGKEGDVFTTTVAARYYGSNFKYQTSIKYTLFFDQDKVRLHNGIHGEIIMLKTTFMQEIFSNQWIKL